MQRISWSEYSISSSAYSSLLHTWFVDVSQTLRWHLDSVHVSSCRLILTGHKRSPWSQWPASTSELDHWIDTRTVYSSTSTTNAYINSINLEANNRTTIFKKVVNWTYRLKRYVYVCMWMYCMRVATRVSNSNPSAKVYTPPRRIPSRAQCYAYPV